MTSYFGFYVLYSVILMGASLNAYNANGRCSNLIQLLGVERNRWNEHQKKS